MPSHQSVGPFFDGLTRSLEDQHGTPKIISFSGISFWGTPHPSKKRERGISFMLVGEVGPQCFHQDTHLSKPQACCREQKEQMNSLAKDTAGHRFPPNLSFLVAPILPYGVYGRVCLKIMTTPPGAWFSVGFPGKPSQARHPFERHPFSYELLSGIISKVWVEIPYEFHQKVRPFQFTPMGRGRRCSGSG